jgi:hypothetical protein
MTKKISINKFTELFFAKRFSDKDIKFEKKCGYFQEWVRRFQDSPNLIPYQADDESAEVIKELKARYYYD